MSNHMQDDYPSGKTESQMVRQAVGRPAYSDEDTDTKPADQAFSRLRRGLDDLSECIAKLGNCLEYVSHKRSQPEDTNIMVEPKSDGDSTLVNELKAMNRTVIQQRDRVVELINRLEI